MAVKNKYGQYFTIPLIAEFMTSLICHPKNCSVLEPSCGKGVFLDSLFANGFSNLSAYEIDKDLDTHFDFVKFKSFLSVPTSEKYDVVIGNPPYIRWKNLEPELREELQNNTLWKQHFNSLCDYLFIFILKSIEHLNENGELIFICTEYWMNTTHSLSLRNYMCRHGYFSEIYHFKEAPLFEKVTASFIIFRFIKKKTLKESITLYSYKHHNKLPSLQGLQERSCFEITEIPHFQENKRWILASQSVQEELAAFERHCEKPISSLFDKEHFRIGDFCDIGNGMVSGLDKAFQIHQTSNLNPIEKKALIRVMKAKDLSPFKNHTFSNYIFVQDETLDDDSFKTKYPNFAIHFEPFIPQLKQRYNYNRSIPYWEFVFPRNQKLFERDEARIFVPCKERISNKDYFRFCYASENYYSTQDVTAIFRKPKCKESIEYILAYLNSPQVFKWLECNGVVKGDIVEFSEAPIASIPFHPIDWSNEEEVCFHHLITNEVKEYLIDSEPVHIENIHHHFNHFFK